MVFEAVVVDLLNRILNEYVENLDTSQLKIGIWGGNVVLNDLKIKSTIFDELSIPVRVKWGKLGRLSLKIPWKNLYSAPALIEVEELLLVVIPFMEYNYDPVKEEKWEQEKKQAKLAAIEEAKKRELEESSDKKDSFLEKLLTQIIKNLQVVIKNIHVRYEDKITIPDSPFSVGVTLSKLSCESTANDTSINYSKFMEGRSFICKKVDLQGLSIYWNSNSELFSDLSSDKLRDVLIETIPVLGNKPQNLMFLFGPLSASAFLRLNPKPENDGSNFTIPKIFVNVHLKTIELGITSSQFCDALSFAEEFERFLAARKYRKFRPKGIPFHGHYKEWWHFAYTAVLEDIIRRRREWSWSHIKEHRRTCKEYSKLFKLKLTSKKMLPEDAQQLEELEKKLNVFSLVLMREQVYVQVERIDKEKKSSGWFGGWFGAGSDSQDESREEELVRKIQRVMTGEEKQKLYKAIGYEETGSPANYPLRFVELQFWFHLDEMKAVVYDNKTNNQLTKIVPILSVSLKSIKMELEERPALAVKFVLIVGRFHVIGKQESDGTHPDVVASTCQESESLIEILYETKPLNSPYDMRIIVNAQPLKIIFHAETVTVVRDIFVPSSSEEIDKIVAATSASLPTFRKITALGLQYAIEKQTQTEVKVNMKSSILIVPYEGVYRPEKDMLVLILGSLNIETEKSTSKKVDVRKMFLEGTTDEEIFSTVLSASYTNFKCHLTGVQVLYQLSGENWVTASQTPKSSIHFLEKTNLELTIKKSLVMDDARIPKIIIEAQVPSLTLNFSEERFLGFVVLISSIAMKITKRRPPALTKKGIYASSWSVVSYQLENTFMTVEKNLNQKRSVDYVQGIDFIGNFDINEMIVNVTKNRHIKQDFDKEEEGKPFIEKKFLNFQVFNLGVEFTNKTFENVSMLKVGGIRCNQYHNKQWMEFVSPTGEENEYLFLGQYINLDTKIPDFYTAKHGIVNRLTLTMTPLNVMLDNSRMLAVLEFVATVQRKIERATEKFFSDRMADAGKETIHEEENVQSDKKLLTKGKRFRKKGLQKEVIDFFLQANLDGLSIVLSFESRGVAKFSLHGGSVEISIRKSYITLDVKVHDIFLQDLHPTTKHPMIVKALEDETLSSRITVYDKDYFGEEDCIDMAIEAEVGGFECTFVRVFFVRVIAFLSGFQFQIETLKQGATIAAQKAKEEVVKAFHNAAKVCLNIKITAPLLVIPRSSQSLEALEIDLGVLTLRNSITELDCSHEEGVGSKPVIDMSKFHLSNLKMARRIISEEGSNIIGVKTFLVPVSFNLTVKRNLSRMWFRVIPEIEILARLATIRINLTNEDLRAILNIVKENISEEDERIKYHRTSHPKSKIKTSPKVTKGLFEHHQGLLHEGAFISHQESQDENFYTIVKFIFFLDSFIFESKTMTSEKEVGLGRFVLQTISAKGRLFSNDSIYTAIQLDYCFVDDTRPGDESRLTRFLGPGDNTDLVDSNDKGSGGLHMVEVIYQTEGDDSYFDIRVYRFRLVISMDYLKRLLEFFTVEDEEPQEEVKPIPKLEHKRSGHHEHKIAEETFTVNIRLEKPDIIFVENLNSFNVDALVFHTELVLKFRVAGIRKIVTATLSDIELDKCSFNPSEGLQRLNQVIKPFTISVAGSTPEGAGLHIDVYVSDIFICIDPSTVNLISNCFHAIMKDSSIMRKTKLEKDYSDLWDVKPFCKEDYSFLQAEVGFDAVRRLSRLSTDASESYNEIGLLSLPSLIILIEGEQTRHMEPLILVEIGFNMRCYNWSENMSILNSLQLQIKYFNKRVYDWEPLIEPVEKISDQCLHHVYIPWELNCSVIYSGEGEFDELRPPQIQITLSSKEILPITLTKTCVDLLYYGIDKYTTAVKTHQVVKVPDMPPFVMKNETGETLELLLNESKLQLYKGLKGVKGYKFVKLDSNSEIELQSLPGGSGDSTEYKEYLFAERRKCPIFVKFPDIADSVYQVSIEKPVRRYHPFMTRSQKVWVFVTDVSIVRNSTLIVFKSICTVKNYFNEPINVHILSESEEEAKYVGTVEGNSVFTLPFKDVHCQSQKLFFSVNGYSLSGEPVAWMETSDDVNNLCLLQCTSKVPENSDPFFIQAYTEKKMIYYGNTNRLTFKNGIYKIHLQPTVKICNSLMFPFVMCFQGSAKEEVLKPGSSSQISNAEPGTTTVTLRIDDYLDKQWSCRETIVENPPEFLIWEFASYSGLTVENLNLGVQVTKQRKTSVYTIYCPYLMINKTGYLLSYKFDGSSTVCFHPGELLLPIMLSPARKKFFSKKMANLKVERSGWSEGFSLDVAGSGGTVECVDPNTDMVYKISVTITLSQNSMARMVVLTPFYVLINSADYNIEYQECSSDDEQWTVIPSHDCVPFWPRSQDPGNTMRIRPENSKVVTPEFSYQSTDVFLLRLPNQYGGINAHIRATNSGTYVKFSSYQPGQAPILLINYTAVKLTIKEFETEFSVVLKPGEQVMHTWLRPTGKRMMLVEDEHNQPVEIEVNEDVTDVLFCDSGILRYVSFLEGSQRIVLFTEDRGLSESISTLRMTTSGLEIISKIHGIGVSLVNDLSHVEIAYMAFFSSGVSWESKYPGKRRFKTMKKEDSDMLEKAYQRFLEKEGNDTNVAVLVGGKFMVNFEKMEMLEPSAKELKRTFEPGLWLAYRQIEDYVMIHLKVHKVQMDGQLLDCVFPVVVAAVPPPKTVAALFQDPKPFFELSVVRIGTDRRGVLQYKYFKCLMQEFHVKLDIGLMHQLYRFVMPLETPEEQERINFRKDLIFVEQKLSEFVQVVSIEGQKHFFDLLHFSPLKIHFSFSVGGKMEEMKKYIPPSMNVMLQSVGATLTDIHDVVFRLSCLERKACFLTSRELKEELRSHYTGQIVRQAYVLLLGLDVIGNPFGLIVGIGQGVEAFFYEPFQGMIRGPSEFGRGVAIGWKRMFGHTVGSAAGTLGKLTDSLGKGLAVLSLDEDYQMRRLTERSTSSSVQTQMARGGKGLVMGVVEGVTGVVRKPIKGACKDGFGGFVKGVGKGMMGLITRPVTGVVDFATTSFYAVNRTTMVGAKNDRLRPPRYIRHYETIKPYFLKEAQGYLIFFELARQKYFGTEKYEYHLALRHKEIFVLTDKRIIFAEFSDVFGTWQEHATFTWDCMPQSPKLHPKGVALSIPKYNKAETKILLVEDKIVREEVFEKMRTLYKNELEAQEEKV